MRRTLIALVLSAAFASTGYAQTGIVLSPEAPEVYATPDHILRESGTGCLVGASTGAIFGILGTLGIGVIPTTALGCTIGAISGPVAAEVYDHYRVYFDATMDRLYQRWQEQQDKTGAERTGIHG